MKQLSKLGISAGLAVVAVLMLSVLLDTSASAGEEGTAGTVPVDTFNVCRPNGDGTFTFVNDVTEALTGDLVDGVDGTFKNQNHCDALAEPPANDPPANDPPANDPPANDPPANDPPANDPPADTGGGNGGGGGDTGGNTGGDTGGDTGDSTSAGEGGAIVTANEEGDIVILQTCTSGDVRATCVPGNPGCPPGTTDLKVNNPSDGTFTDGTLTVTIDVRNTTDGQVFDFTASGATISQIIVKGGPNANVYGGMQSGTGLHAPVNPNNGDFFGLSHISFCYTTEEPEDATIQICKADIPGVEQVFQFTSTIPGHASFSITDGECETAFVIDADDLDDSPFTVTETEPAGFSLLDIDCGAADVEVTDNTVSISVDAGDAVVCTFENEANETVTTGEITICKETIPDEDPEETVFDFNTDAFTLPDTTLLDDQCEDSGPLDPEDGPFGVTEEDPDPFTLTLIECLGAVESTVTFQPSGEETFQEGDTGVEIDLVAGEHVTCTFTNDAGEVFGTGIIEICKEVLAGSDTSQSFTFSGDITIAALLDGECDSESGLDAGEFDVTENVPANWDLVDVVCTAEGESTDSPITNGVTIDLEDGDFVSCTFFNVEEDGPPPPPPGDDDDAADDDDDSDVGGVRQPRTSQVGGVRSPGKPGVGTGDGSFEPFASFKDSADATSTWLPAVGFLAAMGLAGMAVAHVQRKATRR